MIKFFYCSIAPTSPFAIDKNAPVAINLWFFEHCMMIFILKWTHKTKKQK